MAIGLAPRLAIALSVCGKSLTSGHASSTKTCACMSMVRTRCPPTSTCRRAAAPAGVCAVNAHGQKKRPPPAAAEVWRNCRRLNFMPRMVALAIAQRRDRLSQRLHDSLGLVQMDFVAAALRNHERRVAAEQQTSCGETVTR